MVIFGDLATHVCSEIRSAQVATEKVYHNGWIEVSFSPVCVFWRYQFHEKRVITTAALKWFVPSVRFLVYLKMIILWDRFITTAALKLLLLSVSYLMHYNKSSPREILITKAALKWFLWRFPRSKAFWRLNKRVLLEKSLSQWLHWWHTLERSQAISVNEIKLSQTVVIFTSIWWHTLERRISWVGRCCRILVFPWLQYNYNLYSIYIRFFACVRSGCSLDFFGISQYIR